MNGPITYHEASDIPFPGRVGRYEVLADRSIMSRSIATLKARGTYEPGRHPDPADYPPLAAAEHLEMLALGWNIAFYYQHPAQVDHAVRAGASWDKIAAATGTTGEKARAAYREWAEGQHKYAGMDDATYAAALEAAGQPEAAAGPGTAAEDTRRLAAIRAVLAAFDWERDDRQYALEEIARLADGGQP